MDNLTISKTEFKNGESNQTIYLNYHKTYNNPVEPFDLNIKKITAHNEDNVDGSVNLDKNVTFKYARLKYPISFTTYKENLSQNVIFQVYEGGKWQNETSHSAEDGDIKNINTSKITYSKGSISNAKETITFTYGTHQIRPYKEIVHLNIDSWLWFNKRSDKYDTNSNSCKNHPCINLLYLKTSTNAWNGVGTNEKENNVSTHSIGVNIQRHDTETQDRSYQKVFW